MMAKEDIAAEELDKKVGELSEALQKIGQAAYQSQQGQPQQGAPSEGKPSDEKKDNGEKKDKKDVEEGEVVE